MTNVNWKIVEGAKAGVFVLTYRLCGDGRMWGNGSAFQPARRLQAAPMIARKSAAFSEAPPTRAPPTSGVARISRALSGLTEPP
jgi:hypothetical protein